MSKKQDTVWSARPHTLAKIAILRSYLEKWFSILGSTFPGKNLWYVDGFAGPGEYEGGYEGSPVAAIKAADKALTLVGNRWKARAVRCVFIEEDAARFGNLQRCLNRCSIDSRITIAPTNSSFVEGIEALQRADDGPLRCGEPIFAFIDPFGAKGMPFAVVRDLLTRRTVEVLINLDSDGINRIYEAGDWADHDRVLTEVFGDRSWESLRTVERSHERMQAILSLYKCKLLAIPNVRYVFAFEMRSGSRSIDYHLVFASQHSLGLEKMKESMKQLDQDGTYRFCDEHVGQGQLFNFSDHLHHANGMLERFRGATVSYDVVNDYALNESPFVNAKGMLKELEQRNLIEVSANGQRRKNTYPSDRLTMEVWFRGTDSNG